jgi:hypothetical protein
MKIMAASTHNKPRAWLLMIFLSLASGLLIPVTVFSDSTTRSQISTSPADLSNSTTMSETQATNRSSKDKSSPSTHVKKNTLTRGLSGFFILGILINIVMVSIFAWWFSRQWRQTKK